MGQQDVQHLLAYACGFFEGLVQLLPFGLAARLQQASLDDGRQVTVFQLDLVEARPPPLQHVGKCQLLRTGHGRADQLAQVTLARDEAHDRDRPVGRLGLHQFGHLLAFAVQERLVLRVAGQPQDQLVQEQHHGPIAETPRVLGHHRQAAV